MTGVLIITGGSQGIGAATARMAAARGYKVAISYRSGAEYAAKVDEHAPRTWAEAGMTAPVAARRGR